MDFKEFYKKFAQEQLDVEHLDEAKKKKPDANDNGIPDYAEDGKGKNDLKKKKSLKDWFEQIDKEIIAEQTMPGVKQNLEIQTGSSPATRITDKQSGTSIVTSEPSVVAAAKQGKLTLASQLKEKESKDKDKPKDKPNLKHLKRQYRDNESSNAHTENAALLATHFGTDEEVAHARAALKHRDQHGGYNSDDKEAGKHLQRLHRIHTKYGHKLSENVIEEAEKWIQKAIKSPGSLKKQLGVPSDEKIPAAKLNAAAKEGGKLGQRARLAKTLKSFNKEDVSEAEVDESGLQAYLGKKKYGKAGMKALQKAGREGASKETMAKIRAKHDKLDEVQIDEKAVSKKQQKFMGMVHAAQKGKKPASKAVADVAKSMKKGDVKDFAQTKHKGLPEKKKKTAEAEIPKSGPDYGAGLGAGRKNVLETKQVNEAMDTRKVAYHEGKAMGLQHKHACKYNEGSEEHKSFHEGFMKGIEECYNSGVRNEPIVGMEETSMPPATVPGMASAAMPSIPTMEADLDEMNKTEYMKHKARTTPGDKFSAFGQTMHDKDVLEDNFAFESLDKQLNDLLNEDVEINEGLSVSMSTGQQGAPDSVSVTGTDDEAGKLLAFIKQVGLGGMGGDSEGVAPGEPAVVTVSDYGGPKFAGHDDPGMKALMQKVGVDDEEGHGEEHEEVCNECGMHEAKCGCEKEVAETQTPDQLEADAISEDDGEGYEQSQADAGKIDSALALSGASKGGAMNEGGDGMEEEPSVNEAKKHKKESTKKEDEKAEKAGEEVTKDIEYDDKKDKKKKVDEWANDAGKDSLDAAFEQDIEFMMNIISGGLNKPKSTGQQTIPVLAGDKERTNISEDIKNILKILK